MTTTVAQALEPVQNQAWPMPDWIRRGVGILHGTDHYLTELGFTLTGFRTWLPPPGWTKRQAPNGSDEEVYNGDEVVFKLIRSGSVEYILVV